jgi:hypothetical protein
LMYRFFPSSLYIFLALGGITFIQTALQIFVEAMSPLLCACSRAGKSLVKPT